MCQRVVIIGNMFKDIIQQDSSKLFIGYGMSRIEMVTTRLGPRAAARTHDVRLVEIHQVRQIPAGDPELCKGIFDDADAKISSLEGRRGGGGEEEEEEEGKDEGEEGGRRRRRRRGRTKGRRTAGAFAAKAGKT